MAQPLGIYSASLLEAIIAGTKIVGLTDAEDAITIEQDEDIATTTVGASGQFVYNLNFQPFTLTIKLMENSPSNNYLAGLIITQTTLPTAQALPFLLNSQSSAPGFITGTCLVKKYSDIRYGKNNGERVWTLTSGDLDNSSFYGRIV